MSAPQSFGRRLPYWTSRTVDVPNGELAVMIMKDWTIYAGLRVEGVDLYCSPTHELNRIAQVMRDALTTLPVDAYVQTRFESGLSWEASVKAFEDEDSGAAHPILREARRRRAKQIREDSDLTRTQLTYYVGLRNVVGALLPHTAKPRRLFQTRPHPSDVKAQALLRGADRLYNTLRTFMTAIAAAGVRLEILSEEELLDACLSFSISFESSTTTPVSTNAVHLASLRACLPRLRG